MVVGISVSAADFKQEKQDKPFCETCALAKQHRLPFHSSGSKSSTRLELVHMYVWTRSRRNKGRSKVPDYLH